MRFIFLYTGTKKMSEKWPLKVMMIWLIMVLFSLNCCLGTWISINQRKQSKAIKHSFYKTRLGQMVFESLCTSLYVYIFYVHLFMYISVCKSFYVCPYVYITLCISLYVYCFMYICLGISLHVYLFRYTFVWISLYVYLCIFMYVYLFIYIYISLHIPLCIPLYV